MLKVNVEMETSAPSGVYGCGRSSRAFPNVIHFEEEPVQDTQAFDAQYWYNKIKAELVKSGRFHGKKRVSFAEPVYTA